MAVDRLTKLHLSDFQSIREAEIDLGGFSVVVGPSNSGKSALVRALKAVARNVNSPAAVRAGAKVFSVSVQAGDVCVSIERGKSSSTYRLSRYSDGSEEVYAKSGRSVPDDVQAALALPVVEGPDVSFAGQLDPPFLLAETGTTVAKVLGDLTNVSKLHAAAREANRRKGEANRVAKLRREDVEAIRTRLAEQYGTLQQEAESLRELRSSLDEVRTQARATERLAGLLEAAHTASAAERDVLERLERLPEVTGVDFGFFARDAELAVMAQQRFEALVGKYLSYVKREEKALEEAGWAEGEEAEAEQEYARVLKEAGVCPVCGSAVE